MSEALAFLRRWVVAYFNGFSRCAVALGGMPDQMPRTEIYLL